jgi:integrase
MLTGISPYPKPGGSPEEWGIDTMRRAQQIITANDRAIKAAKYQSGERTTERKIGGIPGLWLYIYPSGRKTFHVHYSTHLNGKQVKRKPRLGDYGTVTLADAKQRTLALLALVASGSDPVKDKKERREEQSRDGLTFNQLFVEYLQDQRMAGVESTDEIERAIKTNVLEVLGSKRPSDITDVEIERVVDEVFERGSPSMARHLLTYLRGIFNHALRGSPQLRKKYGLVENPTDTVGRGRRGKPGKYGRPKVDDRFLNDAEIVQFWRALEQSDVDRRTKLVLKLLLLTGQRPSEVRRTEKSELRLEGREPYWNLPNDHTKNDEPHIVPLNPLAVALFKEALAASVGSRYVFPSHETEDGILGEYTARQAVLRLFEQNKLTCARFKPKDLRTTVKTGMARLGVRREIRDAVQNHKPQGIGDKAYNMHDYLPEMRGALRLWTDHVQSLVAGHR